MDKPPVPTFHFKQVADEDDVPVFPGSVKHKARCKNIITDDEDELNHEELGPNGECMNNSVADRIHLIWTVLQWRLLLLGYAGFHELMAAEGASPEDGCCLSDTKIH